MKLIVGDDIVYKLIIQHQYLEIWQGNNQWWKHIFLWQVGFFNITLAMKVVVGDYIVPYFDGRKILL